MKYLFWITSLLISLNIFAKEIALTFDDAPRKAGGYLSGPERSQKLIKALNDVNVNSVVFFSVSKFLSSEGNFRLQR